MNDYLFCTLIFVLLMKSSYAASVYPDDQRFVDESNDFIQMDELYTDLRDKVEDAESVTPDSREIERTVQIETLIDQNFTYLAILISKNTSEVLCQGVVIDPLWIVTSAACMKKYSLYYDKIQAVTGYYLPQVIVNDIKNIYAYPEYQFLSNENDIALAKLDQPIMNDEVIPVLLTRSRDPKTNRCDYAAFYNRSIIAFRADLVSPHDCKRPEIPKQILNYYCLGIAGRQMSTSEEYLLGVPLVCDGELFGVKSFSTIFTSVPEVYDWIVALMDHQPYRQSANDLLHPFLPETSEQKPKFKFKYSSIKGNKSDYIPVAEDHGLHKYHGGSDIIEEDTSHKIITLGNEEKPQQTTTHKSSFFDIW